ncbi:SusE domain-containing protein [Epilithonimonas tenax]|uniref:SusE domain-containing protein n=1 Tax=Epilithonimonas tenax TaxID=191577 RepID=UPI0004278CCB|nr:SusE domain-containing protein [Epilithonimonas tenax]
MKHIFKSAFAIVLLALLFVACSDEADRDWTTPEASFKLKDTSLGSNVLYETMKNNPFILTWESAKTSNYTVVMSATADFAAKVTLGTATTNTFLTTIGDVNTKLLQAGFSPYASKTLYIRIESGSEVSNAISFAVTPYPVAIPVITAPTAGKVLVLNGTTPDANAITFTWDDYATYGVDVKYLLEIAKKGSTVYYPVATVINAKSSPISVKELNTLVLKTGAQAGSPSDVNIRVTATSVSTGGTISKVSDLVTFNVTPYEMLSYLYVPGAYQGWSIDTANTLVSSTSNGVYFGFIDFTAGNLEFKVTPARAWDNSYGTNDNVHLLYNDGGNLSATSAGYQKLMVNTNDLTFSLAPYAMGLVGDATTNGWNGPDVAMTWDDANLSWTATTTLAVGSLKFRVNNAWDENYGGTNGSASAGGSNIAVTEAGTYKITFNPFKLIYTVVKQ